MLPIIPPVSVSVFTPYSTIELDQNDMISGQASAGAPPYTYTWFVNGVQSTSPSSSNTFLFNPTMTGTYQIYVQVTDQNGDTNDSSSLTISVITTAIGCVIPTIRINQRGSECDIH